MQGFYGHGMSKFGKVRMMKLTLNDDEDRTFHWVSIHPNNSHDNDSETGYTNPWEDAHHDNFEAIFIAPLARAWQPTRILLPRVPLADGKFFVDCCRRT